MDAADVCVVSSRDGGGGLVVRIGIPLADVYLEFLGGRCRPNTVLAAAYDLKVFFTVVARPPDQVRPADVLAFITAQRTGRADVQGVLQPVDGGPGGVSAATVRRRPYPGTARSAASSPAGPAFGGRTTPDTRPPDRDDTDHDPSPQLRRRHVPAAETPINQARFINCFR